MPDGAVEVTVGGASGRVRMRVGSAAPGTVAMTVQPGGTLNIAAETAERLRTPRAIALSGDAAGSVTFDGSGDVAIPAVVERLTNEELEAMLT